MSVSSRHTQSSFAHREVVAPVGLWERGAEVSGIILPSARVFSLILSAVRRECTQALARAPKALATPPSGGTHRRENSPGVALEKNSPDARLGNYLPAQGPTT